jgi:hypothetical protein
MSQSVPASDTQSIPTPQQRTASLEAAILASVATGPKSHHEIRKFVQEQTKLDWVFPHHVAEAVNRMRHRRRLVLVWRAMRSIVSFALPEDPCLPFVRTALSMAPNERMQETSERERRLLAKLAWPRFFHVPSSEELCPSVKTRTGYDVRTDYNRF